MRLQFLPYNPSKKSYDQDETAEESPQQHAARVYHGKAKLVRHPVRRKHKSLAEVTNNLAPSSPVTVLGAGRIDPFNAYCTPDHRLIVHEMLDHAISYQWTLFAADEKPDSLLVAKQVVMDTALRFPVCFHALIYSGATHKAFHQSPHVDNSKSALLRLKSKAEALKALRAASKSSETATTDSVLFAMVILAILGYGEKITSATKHEKRTLAAEQDGQFYASQQYEWQHWRAVIEVVKMKGGLHTVGFPGLAFAIASFDIHTAIMFRTKPSFPLFMPSSLVVNSWPSSQPGSPASALSPTMAVGFSFLAEVCLPEAFSLLDVIHGMRDITMAFDSFQRGQHDAPPIKMIIFGRNLNQHELVSLPDLAGELFSDITDTVGIPDTPQTAEALCMYELCRLGAFAFQMTVLLPNLHEDLGVTLPYARSIQHCLLYATTTLHLDLDNRYQDFVLWVTIMMAWLVQGTDMYCWFLDFLVERVSTGYISNQDTVAKSSWPRIRDILARFLWLDSECGEPCQAIWEEVEAMQRSEEGCIIC